MVKPQRIVGKIVPKRLVEDHIYPLGGIGSPSIYHALVIIFLEFFSWGLLTNASIVILKRTFPSNFFLMNGIVQGVKGIFSFLTAPLIGALSDVWGRKIFLLITVAATCFPIPTMKISPWWYFSMLSISGLFSVTFSIIFAYVADITSEEDRPAAYGLVSAMFAASLVTSPLIGSHLETKFGEDFVIILATAVAIADVLFILICVPESLPENLQQNRHGRFSWDQADPFGALRKVWHDRLVLMICLVVFLSYLPEAAEYTCVLLYLKTVFNFEPDEVASFMAFLGILAVIAQTAVLALLNRWLGAKHTIIVGLTFEALELVLFGIGTEAWMMWLAGMVTTVAMICYPAMSAYVSSHSHPDQQGAAQGILTGIRMLCTGLGPALFGFLFFLFNVHLTGDDPSDPPDPPLKNSTPKTIIQSTEHPGTIPGPPFLFGAVMVTIAIVVAVFLPEAHEPRTSSNSTPYSSTHRSLYRPRGRLRSDDGLEGAATSRHTYSDSTDRESLSPLLPVVDKPSVD